ncbi:MAG TPA: HlyD family secretion protein [Polyangiaceae bacterium]|jgi:membrane fusion protein (multidrug efflux system)|nr:HlyD family secretion protein [Polyangiaceae bacterium]
MTSTENTLVGLDANVEVRVPSKRSLARPYLILALVASLALVAYLGFRFLTSGRESTDDAQVAADMVPVSARVGGTVIAVPVADHQNVKKGDLLAEIDPADYENKVKLAQAEIQAAIAQAEAADAQVGIVAAGSKGGLSTAQAALSGSISSVAGADAQIQSASAALARAQADADQADIVLKRAQALSKSEAIPQAELDSAGALSAAQHALVLQAQAELAVANQARQAARSRIAEAEGRVEQSSPVESQQAAARANAGLAHARVASAETALAQAQLNLSYTRVLAPGDGHISKLAVHVGQLVAPTQTITNVLPNVTYLVANFKETQVGSMRAGQSAEISVDAYPGRALHAKVESIAYGTGAQFSLLPPDNASGNFVKVVQRVPVKLSWTGLPEDVRVEAGLSANVTVLTK